jgi:hypothetical protein
MNSTISSLSGGYNFVDAVKQPIIITISVTMTFIMMTSIINACVLFRRTLRSSPCTYYFLASVPPVLSYVIVASLTVIVQNRYGISISNTPVTCKLLQYILYASPLLYVLMLVCASIDRFCSSSSSVRLRRFSQVRVAQRIITIVWILTLTYMSPMLVVYYYDNVNVTIFLKCVPYATTLATAYLISRVILYYFILPIILCVFGTLTIYNIRSLAHRVRRLNVGNAFRRSEGQLARMLIIQVAAYFIFFTPVGITYTIMTFVPSMNTSYFITIRAILVVWQQGGYFIPFFLYILTGKIYQEELKKMFKWQQIRVHILHLRRQHNAVIPLTNTMFNARV